LSQTEAIRIRTDESVDESKTNVQQIHLQVMQKKAAEAKEQSTKTLQKINEIKSRINLVEKKP
jgi:hypothetical protein